jgi:hypothetical protein
MREKKKKFDLNSPGAQALIDEIVHGTFMKEGTMVAFPTCFPGASIPIVADESRITALDITPEGIVYGGTSGKRCHLFVGMFHGVTGMVFDMKTVEDAIQCAAVCVGKKKFLACVNTPRGGQILAAPLQPLPFDLIQEWGFVRPTFDELGVPVATEPIVHAVSDASRDTVVGATSGYLFAVNLEEGRIRAVGENKTWGRLAVGSTGSVVGFDMPGHLWHYDTKAGSLRRRAVALPSGTWDRTPPVWARHPQSGLLYTADNTGRLFSFAEDRGFSQALGLAPLAPVGPMAVTLDGRVFGFCGPDLAKMFCYDPMLQQVTNLGVAVSIIERRRYGYVFGDAVTGRDGEIYFGENENLGHLWIYFPKIKSA